MMRHKNSLPSSGLTQACQSSVCVVVLPAKNTDCVHNWFVCYGCSETGEETEDCTTFSAQLTTRLRSIVARTQRIPGLHMNNMNTVAGVCSESSCTRQIGLYDPQCNINEWSHDCTTIYSCSRFSGKSLAAHRKSMKKDAKALAAVFL